MPQVSRLYRTKTAAACRMCDELGVIVKCANVICQVVMPLS